MKNKLNVPLVLLLSAIIAACSSGKKSVENEGEEVSTAEVAKVIEKKFKYPIPTSFQVTTMLQDANAAFVLNITNPVENVDRYETQRDKALNLGIYGADLSYASTYNAQEETMALLKVTKILIDELEIPGVFNDDMVTRVEQNIDNKDSLILIVTQSFYNTYEELGNSGQDKMGFLVVAASWIEGLYITCNLAISSNYDKGIMGIVAEQKKSAEILSDIATKYAVEDPDVESIRPLLAYMKLVYDGIDPAIGITKGQLDDVFSNVSSTRDEIVN